MNEIRDLIIGIDQKEIPRFVITTEKGKSPALLP